MCRTDRARPAVPFLPMPAVGAGGGATWLIRRPRMYPRPGQGCRSQKPKARAREVLATRHPLLRLRFRLVADRPALSIAFAGQQQGGAEVRQRNLWGIVFLLGWAIAALPGTVSGQNTTIPVAPPGTSSGILPVKGAVIADAQTSPPPPKIPQQNPQREFAPPIYEDVMPATVTTLATGVAHSESPAPPAPPATPRTVDRPLSLQGSTLSLLVEGPEEVEPGQSAAFSVIARNVGTTILSAVHVELPVPSRCASSDTSRKPSRRETVSSGASETSKREAGMPESRSVKHGDGGIASVPTGSFAVSLGQRTRVARPPFELAVTGRHRRGREVR